MRGMSTNHVLTSPLVAMTLVLGVPASAALAAQAKPTVPSTVSQANTVTETFTIDAIDYKGRLVTLRGDDGVSETIYCGPEVQRFDALKAGDKVTFRYQESVVYEITKPGAPAAAAEAGGVTRTPGASPGGTISQKQVAVVTINEIDLKAPSVTVTTKDGRKMGFKIQDPANMAGVKVGDQVQITYSQALAVSVEPAAK
jgi:Cu/Ag efflux protein CusF